MEVNEEAVNNYFKKLDFDIYYGKEQVAKPVEFLRKLYEDMMKEKQRIDGDNSTIESETSIWLIYLMNLCL